MPQEKISPAAIADIPQLLQLVNSAYRGDAARAGWTHEADLIEGTLRIDAGSMEPLIKESGSIILKYEMDGKIYGCVNLQKQGTHMYLGLLSVSPHMQAHGIGKQLLAAADEHARKNHCDLIEMSVIPARTELIAWYERHGFRCTEKRKPFHNDDRFGIPRQPIEFMVMEKKL